jgi:hypothetical protein
MRRNVGVWALALLSSAVTLAAPAGAAAAVRLGPDLTPVQNSSAFGCQGGMYSPCSWINYASANPAVAMTSPVNGVVTRWRFRAGCCSPAQTEARTMTLKTFAPVASSDGYVHLDPVATGPSFVVPAGNAVVSDPAVELPARMPIAVGQSVGIVADYPIEFATYSVPSVNFTILFNGFTYGGAYGNALAINADVEPDADGDGYGDETQDCQPTTSAQHEACPQVFLPPPPNPPSVGTTGPCKSGCGGGSTGVTFSNPPRSIPTPRGDGGVVVELQCPPGSTSPCGGILYMELPKPKSGKPRVSSAAPTVLARAAYSIAPGKKKSFELKFSKKVFNFLARKRTRKVIVTVQPKGGQPVSTTRTLKFAAPKPARGH